MNSTTNLQTVEIFPVVTNLEQTSSIHLMRKKKKSNALSFNELMLETVDSTFSALGDSGKRAIYCSLEKKYGLKKGDIPSNVATFACALEDIFGQAAFLLETKIIHALHSKVHSFKYYPQQNELSFVVYLENLRRYL